MDELTASADARTAIAEVNELTLRADERRGVVRLAAGGALLAWAIALFFAALAPDPFACAAVVAVGGAVGGGLIAQREIGPAAGMPLFAALTVPLALLTQALGLAGPIPEGMAAIARILPLVYALVAWSIVGGALALANERHRVRRLRTA